MTSHRSAGSPIKLTYEDYLYFPDDGRRHEIIDGEHYASLAPKIAHQRILGKLFGLLDRFVSDQRLGQVLLAPVDVVLSPADVVQPDLLFLSTGKRHLLTEDNLRGAPDLVVEILTERTRQKDEITKRHVYERFGVQEYWIIDPELETVKVYRRSGDRFEGLSELSMERDDRFVSPLFPGLELRLSELFQK